MTSRLSIGIVGSLFLSACPAQQVEQAPSGGTTDAHLEAGTMQEVTDFGSNPAQLRMYAYVPSGMPDGPRPLVVAMHGCQQTALQYVAAGWNVMAELWKFHVVYPEQNKEVNNQLGCFNWGGSWDGAPNTFVFDAPLHLEDLERGHAENLSIKQMVDHMKDEFSIDAGRVYASGLSAGGGMTAVMLATYPDVFAGGAIVAGVPYGCSIVEGATTQEGTDCVNAHPESHELNRTPQEWGDLVRDAYPGYDGPYPDVSIWHGSSDFTVATELATELVEQWTNVHGIDMEPDASTTIGPAEHTEYQNDDGRTVVETFIIGSMGHGQPIDTAQPCGEAGAFFNDVGLCTAFEAGKYFGLDGEGNDTGDPDGPDVDVIRPANGADVAGTVEIEIEASDPDGVSSVEVYVDDRVIGSAQGEPMVVGWNAAQAANGAHRIKAVAYDTGGAQGVDDDTTVYVTGGTGPDAGPGGGGGGGGGGNGVDGEGGACDGSGSPSGTLALVAAVWLLCLRPRRGAVPRRRTTS